MRPLGLKSPLGASALRTKMLQRMVRPSLGQFTPSVQTASDSFSSPSPKLLTLGQVLQADVLNRYDFHRNIVGDLEESPDFTTAGSPSTSVQWVDHCLPDFLESSPEPKSEAIQPAVADVEPLGQLDPLASEKNLLLSPHFLSLPAIYSGLLQTQVQQQIQAQLEQPLSPPVISPSLKSPATLPPPSITSAQRDTPTIAYRPVSEETRLPAPTHLQPSSELQVDSSPRIDASAQPASPLAESPTFIVPPPSLTFDIGSQTPTPSNQPSADNAPQPALAVDRSEAPTVDIPRDPIETVQRKVNRTQPISPPESPPTSSLIQPTQSSVQDASVSSELFPLELERQELFEPPSERENVPPEPIAPPPQLPPQSTEPLPSSLQPQLLQPWDEANWLETERIESQQWDKPFNDAPQTFGSDATTNAIKPMVQPQLEVPETAIDLEPIPPVPEMPSDVIKVDSLSPAPEVALYRQADPLGSPPDASDRIQPFSNPQAAPPTPIDASSQSLSPPSETTDSSEPIPPLSPDLRSEPSFPPVRFTQPSIREIVDFPSISALELERQEPPIEPPSKPEGTLSELIAPSQLPMKQSESSSPLRRPPSEAKLPKVKQTEPLQQDNPINFAPPASNSDATTNAIEPMVQPQLKVPETEIDLEPSISPSEMSLDVIAVDGLSATLEATLHRQAEPFSNPTEAVRLPPSIALPEEVSPEENLASDPIPELTDQTEPIIIAPSLSIPQFQTKAQLENLTPSSEQPSPKPADSKADPLQAKAFNRTLTTPEEFGDGQLIDGQLSDSSPPSLTTNFPSIESIVQPKVQPNVEPPTDGRGTTSFEDYQSLDTLDIDMNPVLEPVPYIDLYSASLNLGPVHASLNAPILFSQPPLGLPEPLAVSPDLMLPKLDVKFKPNDLPEEPVSVQLDAVPELAPVSSPPMPIDHSSPASTPAINPPEAWSSLEDLMGQSPTLPESWEQQFHLESPLGSERSRSIREELISPIATTQPLTKLDSAAAELRSSQIDLLAEVMQPGVQAQVNERQLEWLAHMVYGLIRDRLAVDRERYLCSVANCPPWIDIVNSDTFKSIKLTPEANAPNALQQSFSTRYPPSRYLEALTQEVYQQVHLKLERDKERQGIYYSGCLL